jgi:hypothetical protein
LPAEQLMQTVAPDTFENLPTGQAVQVVLLIAPDIVEYFPASQTSQVVFAMLFLYAPASHVSHLHIGFVKSTPPNMAFVILEIVASDKYSSMTNTPATSPLKFGK